jgi:hypothetical protein
VALFTTDGETIAQAASIPIHLGESGAGNPAYSAIISSGDHGKGVKRNGIAGKG